MPPRHFLTVLLWSVSLSLIVPTLARAQDSTESSAADQVDEIVLQSSTFLEGHPDMRWRLLGVRALRDGFPAAAFGHFQRAARFADKPSQAMIAEMFWEGNGVGKDRALAYAWMDLAAERGRVQFIAHRERYWEALTAEERDRALVEGRAIYAEYGDRVAKRRQAQAMQRAQRTGVTGSRTGHVGYLKVWNKHAPGADGWMDGSEFHDTRYWNPDQYWDWQDEIWDQMSRRGIIDVLPIQSFIADDETDTGTEHDGTRR